MVHIVVDDVEQRSVAFGFLRNGGLDLRVIRGPDDDELARNISERTFFLCASMAPIPGRPASSNKARSCAMTVTIAPAASDWPTRRSHCAAAHDQCAPSSQPEEYGNRSFIHSLRHEP